MNCLNLCESHGVISSCVLQYAENSILSSPEFGLGYIRVCTPPISLDPPSPLTCMFRAIASKEPSNKHNQMWSATLTFSWHPRPQKHLKPEYHLLRFSIISFLCVAWWIFGVQITFKEKSKYLDFKKSELNFFWDDMALRQNSDKEPSIELFIKVSNSFSNSIISCKRSIDEIGCNMWGNSLSKECALYNPTPHAISPNLFEENM